MQRLFAFDVGHLRSDLLPLAARRALDLAGLRLSRSGWASLGKGGWQELTRLGSAVQVDTEAVQRCTEPADPPPVGQPVQAEPPSLQPPPEVVAALAHCGRLTPAIWSALEPIERYALAKVALRPGPERKVAAYRELVGDSEVSTHLAPTGGVRMVNVGAKPVTPRRAVAESRVCMSAPAFELLRARSVPKGDVLATARLAGIMAAKRTAEWIPLCHPLPLTHLEVALRLDASGPGVLVRATAETLGRTGVEMEALVAASCASLTIYDMLKGVDRAMVVGPTQLAEKSGGASADFLR